MQIKSLLLAFGLTSVVSAVPTNSPIEARDVPATFKLRRWTPETGANHQMVTATDNGYLVYGSTAVATKDFTLNEYGNLVQISTQKTLNAIHSYGYTESTASFGGPGNPLVCSFGGSGGVNLVCINKGVAAWKSWGMAQSPEWGTDNARYMILHGKTADITNEIFIRWVN
ncbi:hypothetical protein DRE_06756 [Drechslerella stenobrocha 248]|uniref:Uncharacterized protein n=1 Tax=Drechslerella stenobrocha 248 TaxID=1043628 RepID=W7HX57_9PEZI|nr:hypothetical protein DRE_06756 [Drechslerella stenobrocha 248]